jgi:signal transduction histidine kinase
LNATETFDKFGMMYEREGEDPSTLVCDFGHVASGVGHHVINAFAAVVSNAEILKLALESRSTVDREVLLNSIIRAALDASVVARRMIDSSRTHTHPGDSLVDLNELVNDYVSRLRVETSPAITWNCVTETVPKIMGRRDQLIEMIDLLIQNAQDATPHDGRLSIDIRLALDARGWVALEVSDNGVGMHPATIERALEPFFSTKPGHTGIGLTIANGIWRRHKGTLSLQSSPGTGTKVLLCIDPTEKDRITPKKPSDGEQAKGPVPVESASVPPQLQPGRLNANPATRGDESSPPG